MKHFWTIDIALIGCVAAAGCGEGSPYPYTPPEVVQIPGCGEVGATAADCIRPAMAWPAGPEDDIKGLPTAEATYKGCAALWSCAVASCAVKPGPGCVTDCLKVGSFSAVYAFTNVTKCAIHVCAKDRCLNSTDPNCMTACMWTRCRGFAVACSSVPGATGNSGCGEALDCLAPCIGHMGCSGACFGDMRQREQGAFITLWKCIAASDAEDADIDCYDKALACGADGAVGETDCFGVLQCSGACGIALNDLEFKCNAKCYGTGSVEAQTTFEAVVNCYTGFAQGESPGACGSVLAACVKPQGVLTCSEVDPCRALCLSQDKTEGICTFECLRRTTPSSADRYLALALCRSVTCAQACAGSSDPSCATTCYSTKCGAERDACLGG